MNTFQRIFLSFSLAFFSILCKADPVQQLNQIDILSIHEYQVISSTVNGDNLTRTIAVVVRNETTAPLYHVYLHLDGMPSHVSGSGSLYFPELGVGELQQSNKTIDITVDLSRQTTPELELVWQIKTEINGEQVIDEIAVSEVIQ